MCTAQISLQFVNGCYSRIGAQTGENSLAQD
jgi:hypothetical protein